MKSETRLAKMKALGRTRFILVYGVGLWGLSTAVLFAGWTWFTHDRLRPTELVLPFVVFPIGGIVWGAVMWPLINRKLAAAQGAKDV